MNPHELVRNNKELAEIAENIRVKVDTNYESITTISYIVIILINIIKLYLACQEKRPNLYTLLKRVSVTNRLILRREIKRIIPEDFVDERSLERYIIQEAKKLSEQRLQEICSKYSV